MLDDRSGPQASSLRRERFAERAGKNVIAFCLADRNLSSTSLANFFQSRKKKKEKKQLDQPAEGVHVRLCQSIVDLLSVGHWMSLSKSVVFGFFKFVAS